MVTHQEIVTLLSEAGRAGEVNIGVRRKVPRSGIKNDFFLLKRSCSPFFCCAEFERSRGGADGFQVVDEMQRSSVISESAPREVLLERRPDGGFGFVLQSSIHDTGCSICKTCRN